MQEHGDAIVNSSHCPAAVHAPHADTQAATGGNTERARQTGDVAAVASRAKLPPAAAADATAPSPFATATGNSTMPAALVSRPVPPKAAANTIDAELIARLAQGTGFPAPGWLAAVECGRRGAVAALDVRDGSVLRHRSPHPPAEQSLEAVAQAPSGQCLQAGIRRHALAAELSGSNQAASTLAGSNSDGSCDSSQHSSKRPREPDGAAQSRAAVDNGTVHGQAVAVVPRKRPALLSNDGVLSCSKRCSLSVSRLRHS